MVQNTNSVVYLAPANVGIPLPSFQEKGISDLMPGELDNVTVIATSNCKAIYMLELFLTVA